MYVTKGDLATAIQAETARSDTATVARISEFIRMGEERLFQGEPVSNMPALRVREMETRSTLTFTDGSASLPTGFLQARRLTWGSSPSAHRLFYREPEDFYEREFWGSTPRAFCIEGSNIDVKPAASGTATIVHYARPAVLAAPTDTNAILTSYGHLYLYSALIDAYAWLRNPDKGAESIQRLIAGISGANLTAVKSRYAGTQLSPRTTPGAF